MVRSTSRPCSSPDMPSADGHGARDITWSPAVRAFRRLFVLAALTTAVAAAGCARPSTDVSVAASHPEIEIRLTRPSSDPAAAFIDVVGVSDDALAALRKTAMNDEGWAALLRV